MISIQPGSGVPPYEQIRSQIQHLVQTGELLRGARLPTVRRLAADLGLATNTVARAYRELEADGVVETRGRAGTVVASTDDRVRSEAESAAVTFAALTKRLGIDPADAVRMLQTALHARDTGSAPSE
jgi:DNA-binding transcriptional regulator YhcF (GntR family)